MRKRIALLLAAVLCVSLAACGEKDGEAGADGPQEPSAASAASAQDADGTDDKAQTKQTVEVTLDNWQEYFEIHEYLEGFVSTNAFDEATSSIYFFYTVFQLKNEFAENLISYDVAVEYDADYSKKNITFNAVDFTFNVTANEDDSAGTYDETTFSRGRTGKLDRVSVVRSWIENGKVETETIPLPAAILISGHCQKSHVEEIGLVFLDDDTVWSEMREGYVDYCVENFNITRIEGTLVISQ